jgi:hypothetical protein
MIEVVIYDAPEAASSGCACGCGGHHHGQGQLHDDPLSRVNVELQSRALAMTLERYFPGQVKVEYINVLKDPRGARLPQTKLLCSLAYPTPLVYINGKGRFAGAIPVERIRQEVALLLNA